MVEGLAGGLLKVLPPTGFVAAEVVEVVLGRLLVDSLGAAGLVGGLVGGWVVFGLSAEVSSAAAVREDILESMKTTFASTAKCRRKKNRGAVLPRL